MQGHKLSYVFTEKEVEILSLVFGSSFNLGLLFSCDIRKALLSIYSLASVFRHGEKDRYECCGSTFCKICKIFLRTDKCNEVTINNCNPNNIIPKKIEEVINDLQSEDLYSCFCWQI